MLRCSPSWSAWLVALACLLLRSPGSLAADGARRTLAVLEFSGDGIAGAALNAFADAVRGGVVDGLAGRGIKVMTRENMMVLLRSMGRSDCAEGDCEVETARNIGADFVISGSAARIENVYVITLKLHESREGGLLGTDRVAAKTQLEALDQLQTHGRDFVAKKLAPPPSPTPASTPAPTPPRAVASVPTCAPNQVLIPGGASWMGSQNGQPNEKPVHQVTLSPYCMDKTEVTVAEYRACVQAGACPPGSTVNWKDIEPEDKTRGSRFCNWSKSGVDRHPINCVDWTMAGTYCKWTGGRLPSEAEWELGARGNDGRTYPWGNQAPSADLLSWHLADGTRPVGSFPSAASPFGLLDMAGNVWEWTADAYGAYTAQADVVPRRVGTSDSTRVIRGGGWSDYGPSGVRAANRGWMVPADRREYLGFRCARDVKL